ncbi:luciferase family oxidoreductase group 1 [Rhizobium sp. BK196]|uniref:LLM class flavin-dependent oxidoreductase n=1 Tax=Rhizobium sp. BK196 TaxID=2587073 RepID=UPI0016105E10|nr:LLM class flavin-dependent oxidoreductase [Rhizobium sp. BK196]MBB3312873.1 luciferase family oxidoreductase group 1 [Rhizobium sp. BK196]
MVPFSILDLSPVADGTTISQSFAASKRMAQKAEEFGYTRFWMAEHHGMPGVASAATSVILGQIGAVTKTIRIGSGGVMLPNHAPLVIAEQFGTLEALFPGRVDLGLGRAPGTDMRTAQALRRNLDAGANSFPNDVVELQQLLGAPIENQAILAVPGSNSNIPIWLLGSSLYSAQLAAMLGLPFAFASHFAPDMLLDAIAIYRDRFQPSSELDKPYVMVGVMGAVSETDEEARYHFTSAQQQFVNLRRNVRGPFPRPVKDMDAFWSPMEKMNVEHTLRYAVVGSPATAEAQLNEFLKKTQADEVIISMPIHDIEARLKSVELFAGLGNFMRAAA